MTIPVEMSFFTILETNTPHSGLCCENALVPSIGFSTFDAVITTAPFAHDRLAYEPIAKYIGGTVSAIDGKQIPIFEEDVVTLICKSPEVKEAVISKLKSYDNLQEAAS